MKNLLKVLSILSLATTIGNLSNFLNTNIQKPNISYNQNEQKNQQDTIYINEKGELITTKEHDLSNIDSKEIIQIGFYKNQYNEIQVVQMPKTVKKVPDQLPQEITSLNSMFHCSVLFNQDISSWNTSNVTDMSWMFAYTSLFNQNISKWDTSNVISMNYMFYNASLFNQNISKWDTSKVTNMRFMFQDAWLFNQDISKWDTSKVTNMDSMFMSAILFNQNLSKWNVNEVKSHDSFDLFSGIKESEKIPKFKN